MVATNDLIRQLGDASLENDSLRAALAAAERRAEEARVESEGVHLLFEAERAAREKAELEFLAAVFERDEEKLNTALAESRLSRAVGALREIDAKIGHFADMKVTEFPHALVPLVARTVKAVLAEVGK